MSDEPLTNLFFWNEKKTIALTSELHSQRRVLIQERLTEQLLRKKAQELLMLEMQNNDPITLIIASPGGEAIPVQQFGSIIAGLHSPVDTLAMGNCASGAVDLLQMGRRRQILPTAQLLIHYARTPQMWICDDLERLDEDLRCFRERAAALYNQRQVLYQSRTGLPIEKIKEMFRYGEVQQASISATQALKMNLVDEILTDFKLLPAKPRD
jgi:ATP-dependent protease ClpP protease subunit